MICSFLAGRPGRDRPNAAGAARFCEWVFVMGETHTHARFCGVSLLAAAKLQQLLHLSFCPYFFGFPAPALALILNKKTRGHAPCETSSAGMRAGVCANILLISLHLPMRRRGA